MLRAAEQLGFSPVSRARVSIVPNAQGNKFAEFG
jgi:hypothetical protein